LPLVSFPEAKPVEVRITVTARLSARENQAVQLIAEGCTNKEIAERMRVSLSTAKYFVSCAMRKLVATNRVELLKNAIQAGIVKL
jgi:DNA-binding NarL/FixJ family response regulator